MGKVLESKAIIYLIIIIIFCGNPPWFIWGNANTYICVLSILILIVLLYHRKRVFYEKSLIFCLFILLPTFVIIPAIRGGLHFTYFFYFLLYYYSTYISDEEKIKSFDILSKILATIIAISLPLWIIHIFLFNLPTYEYIDLSDMKGRLMIMENHYFLVTVAGLEKFRFYSIFDEPGVLGTLSAFVLYGNSYNFKKWYNIVILIGAFFTYSFAFYGLTVIGYLFVNVKNPKKLIITLLCLFSLLIFAYNHLKEDPAFSESVVDRVLNIKEVGLEHRAGDSKKDFDRMLSSSQFLWGIGLKQMEKKGYTLAASYKMFLFEYGFVGLFVLLVMYFRITNKSYLGVAFFMIFFMSFAQRPAALNAWQIILYSCVMSRIKINQTLAYHKRPILEQVS